MIFFPKVLSPLDLHSPFSVFYIDKTRKLEKYVNYHFSNNFWFLWKNWVMGRKLSIYLVGVCAALIGGRSVGGIGNYSSAGPGGIRVVRSRWHRSRWQVAETRSRDPSCSFSATGQVLPTDGLSQRWVCSTYIPSHCSALVVHHFLTGGWLAQNKLLTFTAS